jgi:inositol oxygenase
MAADLSVVPGKAVGDFRIYDKEKNAGVFDHYRQMRSSQCLAFSRAMTAKWRGSWGSRPNSRMTVREALKLVDSFVDRSDPDTSLPNSIHMLQSAEAARAASKPDWFILCALLHDIGKLMHVWGCAEEGQGGTADAPQWALGGDTWVVGAQIPACAVYAELNELNPDAKDPLLSSPLGIYKAGCGMMNLEYAFGHDEYGYLWALHNKVQLPPEGLAILRLHSCYPWHTGGAYKELMAPGDEVLMAAVNDFNQFDVRVGV